MVQDDTITTMVREAAVPLECRLAYDGVRENADGGVRVSLDFHPNDRPDALLSAPPGTRFLLVAVELDDNDTPRRRRFVATIGRPGQAYEDMLPSAQAGMLCNNPRFHEFLTALFGEPIMSFDDASDAVCLHCGVDRKRELATNPDAGRTWAALDEDFQHWKRTGEMR
ncbi:hypothetical protein TSA6c_17120 [Azospirillum sp. TSA6c]|uniref:hypothetical protein n=1 Tax=Azospirillum sp. TSA6c TaxID=709813 RepID=UPI000D60F06D|nr:hypothetical protein [Azospirillum sp. TSA6c]PWC48156.1 hypothetical protein TSA6c_17120 [Azospirillum sp. TSA6c]